MNFKIVIILSFCLFVFGSCKKDSKSENIDYALFSGKISNTEEKEFKVTGANDFIKVIQINEDGSFKDTLKIPSKGMYRFRIGPERSSIHLNKGDQLDLSINVNQFDESIKYTGNAGNKNNYLAKKYLLAESYTANGPGGQAKLYSKDALDFKNEIQKQKDASITLLQKYKDLDSDFLATEKKDIHYEYLLKLSNFERFHRYFTKKQDFTVPENYLTQLKDLDIDNAEDFDNSVVYQKLSIMTFNRLAQTTATQDNISKEKALTKNLLKIKSENIKNALLENLSRQISVRNDNTVELYQELMNMSGNEEFKEKITKQYEKIKKLVKGNDSPLFTGYENYKGGTASLTDFKGKYVYIDVWATWCGPCKAEIPHLKKVEKEFHDKNIEFVSISVDRKKQHEAWKKMVEEKELGGVQLFADNNFSSQFVVDYAIQGIPRFILIDPEGKIISASAPRPSDPSLIEVFNELNI